VRVRQIKSAKSRVESGKIVEDSALLI